MVEISILEWAGCILVVAAIIMLFTSKNNGHGKNQVRV